MLSDEEKKAIKELTEIKELFEEDLKENYEVTATLDQIDLESLVIVLNLIEKQSKEIEKLKETLKCTQNSWYEDTQKIEEMKKQIDLDNECEIALNNRIMDLENADKKWEDKIKAKTIEIKNRPVKDEFITVSQGKLNTIIDMESLLEKE